MEKLIESKELKAKNPLNELLKRIDHSIQRDDPEIHRILENEQLNLMTKRSSIGNAPSHHVSTHNNLKESLYRTNNIKFRLHDGFIGPIRDIFKYKTTPQKTKIPIDSSLSQKSIDFEEFSM